MRLLVDEPQDHVSAHAQALRWQVDVSVVLPSAWGSVSG